MGFAALLAMLLRAGVARVIAQRAGLAVAGGTVLLADVLDVDFFRGEANRILPGSDPDALDDAARAAARAFGLDGGEAVLWPAYRRGAKRGEPITPEYLVISLRAGRAWFSSNYYSKASLDAKFKRGRAFGAKGERSRLAQEHSMNS